MDAQSLWFDAQTALRNQISPTLFTTWIADLSGESVRDSDEKIIYFSLVTPHRAKVKAIREQFAAKIEVICSDLLQRQVVVNIASVGAKEFDKGAPAAEAVVVPTEAATPFDHRLNTQLTFETLVVGKSNELARAAAQQIASNPGKSYNPFFIYGGVGLGKTHLMQAIGNEVLAHSPHAKVRYIHANDFVADVVRAYKEKAFESFKASYNALDVLLVDDVQFFAKKERTQEEFFYAFEHFLSQNKQLVLTSDTFPRDLTAMDARLVSRFNSGLTLAISAPEFEMRVAILKEKAKSKGFDLPEEIGFYIAKNLNQNVRELEGALQKLFVYCEFTGAELSLATAQAALRDIIQSSQNAASLEQIQQVVADFYAIKIADMFSKRRPANIARPRQIAMYLAKELTQKSLPEIGESFGGRDHTTVLHAIRKIHDEKQSQSSLQHELRVLMQMLKA